MKTVTENVFIHLEKHSWENEYKVTFYPCDMSEYGYILIGEEKLTITIPDMATITKKHIAVLHAKQDKLKAEVFVKVEQLQEEINKLLCLENKSND